MNCHYCQKECKTISLGSSYECKSCNVSYYHTNVNLHCELNGKEYIMQFRYTPTNHPAAIIMKELYRSYPIEEVLTFTKMPSDITPSNVRDKIKLYLLLS